MENGGRTKGEQKVDGYTVGWRTEQTNRDKQIYLTTDREIDGGNLPD